MKKICRRCGDNVWPHADENPCPALNETCEYCSLKGHRAKACKKKKKSDKEKQEKDDGSKVELITNTGRGYLLQVKNVASRQKNTLKPLKYDRSLGKFVHKSGIEMQKTGVEIRIDRDNYALINKDIMNNKFPHIDTARGQPHCLLSLILVPASAAQVQICSKNWEYQRLYYLIRIWSFRQQIRKK